PAPETFSVGLLRQKTPDWFLPRQNSRSVWSARVFRRFLFETVAVQNSVKSRTRPPRNHIFPSETFRFAKAQQNTKPASPALPDLTGPRFFRKLSSWATHSGSSSALLPGANLTAAESGWWSMAVRRDSS